MTIIPNCQQSGTLEAVASLYYSILITSVVFQNSSRLSKLWWLFLWYSLFPCILIVSSKWRHNLSIFIARFLFSSSLNFCCHLGSYHHPDRFGWDLFLEIWTEDDQRWSRFAWERRGVVSVWTTSIYIRFSGGNLCFTRDRKMTLCEQLYYLNETVRTTSFL